MATLRINEFLGENRAMHPTLLPDAVGTLSRNQKPGRGDLRPWNEPVAVASVPGGRKTIYRLGRDVVSDTQYWLSWPTVVHAVRGFDPEDTSERTYYTGDGAPKVTDNVMALGSAPYPTTYRPLGLPPPDVDVAVVVSGGSAEASLASYFYCYTFVNDWGWESGRSPITAEVECKTDALRTLSGFGAAPSGNYFVTRIRIYRTETNASDSSPFYFVREVPYGTISTTDDNRILGEQLPSDQWLTPPDDLHHLTAMWNGMMAGISGAAVRLCEAYKPYAWPLGYDVVPPDGAPVALGVFGQSLLVLTTGRPLLVSGSVPDALDQIRLEIPQACASAQSVVSMGTGVAWSSEDGLCWFGPDGASILTAGLMTREDWQAINPNSVIGQMYEGLYFGSYDPDDGLGRRGFFINPVKPLGIFFMDVGYETLHFDGIQDQLFVYLAGQILRWDAGLPMNTVYRSKVWRLPRPVTSFACAEVVAEQYPLDASIDALAMNAQEVTAMVLKFPGNFEAIDSTTLRFTETVTSSAPFRLPAGFAAQEWRMEVSTPGAVQSMAVAHSVAELKAQN